MHQMLPNLTFCAPPYGGMLVPLLPLKKPPSWAEQPDTWVTACTGHIGYTFCLDQPSMYRFLVVAEGLGSLPYHFDLTNVFILQTSHMPPFMPPKQNMALTKTTFGLDQTQPQIYSKHVGFCVSSHFLLTS